jgi:hypothetical protein
MDMHSFSWTSGQREIEKLLPAQRFVPAAAL